MSWGNPHHTIVGRSHNWDVDSVTSGFWQYQVTAADTNVTAPVLESEPSNRVEVGFGDLPPWGLTAADGYADNAIRLQWEDPETPPSTEVILHDDGTPEQAMVYLSAQPNFGWWVAHYQGRDTITVMEIKYYATNQAIVGSSIQVGVFADSGDGTPTYTPLGVTDVTVEEPLDQFVTISLDPPVVIPNGSFFVGVRQTQTGQTGYLGLGADTDSFVDNTFYSRMWTWVDWTAFEQDWGARTPMLRARVRGQIGSNMLELPRAPLRTTPWPVSAVPSKKANRQVRFGVSRNNAPPSSLASASAIGLDAQKSRTGPLSKGIGSKGSSVAKKSGAHSLQTRSLSVMNRQSPATVQSRGHHRTNPLDVLTEYRIFRDGVRVGTVPQGTYTFTDAGLVENMGHSYVVTAHDDDGQDSPSSNVIRDSCNMPPAAPSNLTGTSIGASAMRLTWTDPVTNADGTPCVDLARLSIRRDGQEIGLVNPGIQSYLDIVPNPTTVYTWEVRAQDEVPNVSASMQFSRAVQSPWSAVTFDWIDIFAVGQSAGNMDDDENVGPFALGFDFPFYGQTYNAIRVCTNGWLSFMSTGTETSGSPIPNVIEPNCALYPFWDDLVTSDNTQVVYYSDAGSRQFILSFLNMARYDNPALLQTFQVVISQSGTVRFNYQTIDDNSNLLCGVENCDGTAAIQLLL